MRKTVYSLLALTLLSCGNSKEESPARDLYNQANEAFEKGDYSRSILMLDSLQKAYPAEVAVGREALALRPRVIEQQTLKQITTNDSLTAYDKATLQQLQSSLKWVKTPRMIEGYWVAAQGYNPDFMNTTTIQGRVSEIGEFYIVSSMKPGGNHTAISLSSGAASASTPSVAYDGESNYRIDGGEIITFSPAQSDTIGAFAQAHSGQALTLTFSGRSPKTVKLTPAQVDALGRLYSYSQAVIRSRELHAERQRLEATLRVARSQMARTTPDTPDTSE